ncbi:hypothetical protein PENSPDRAFT_671851 [Peniophora sp. CONT]|nr:hypothetical protein PENSPDRAFT_671851 [Peniophora sp. CONT]
MNTALRTSANCIAFGTVLLHIRAHAHSFKDASYEEKKACVILDKLALDTGVIVKLEKFQYNPDPQTLSHSQIKNGGDDFYPLYRYTSAIIRQWHATPDTLVTNAHLSVLMSNHRLAAAGNFYDKYKQKNEKKLKNLRIRAAAGEEGAEAELQKWADTRLKAFTRSNAMSFDRRQELYALDEANDQAVIARLEAARALDQDRHRRMARAHKQRRRELRELAAQGDPVGLEWAGAERIHSKLNLNRTRVYEKAMQAYISYLYSVDLPQAGREGRLWLHEWREQAKARNARQVAKNDQCTQTDIAFGKVLCHIHQCALTYKSTAYEEP